MSNKIITLTEDEYSYVLGAVSIQIGKQQERLDTLLAVTKDITANIEFFKEEVEKGKQLIAKLLNAKDAG